MDEDVKLAQLISSKLCHDFVGPAGAINTGMEFIADEGVDADSLDLVTSSGDLLATRLAYYRVAFGGSGGEEEETSTASVRALAEQFFQNSKIHLDWSAGSHEPSILASRVAKVLMLMLMMAADGMPRGGVLSVHIAALPEGSGIVVTGAGTGVRIRDDLRYGLTETAINIQINARNVHSYYAQRLAMATGGHIEADVGEQGDIRFMVLFPATE